MDLKPAPTMGEGVAGGRAATRAAPTMAETGGKKSPPANRRGASGVAYLVLVALVIMPSLGRWQALGACYAGLAAGHYEGHGYRCHHRHYGNDDGDDAGGAATSSAGRASGAHGAGGAGVTLGAYGATGSGFASGASGTLSALIAYSP